MADRTPDEKSNAHKARGNDLVNSLCLFVPIILMVGCPALTIYFIAMAPAWPIVIGVLFLRMRNEWSRPEVVAGLTTLTGFGIGYLILFFHYYQLLLAKFNAMMQALHFQ